MTYKIQPFAQADLEESMDWYAQRHPGLEIIFLESVKEAIGRIGLNPYTYAVKYRRGKLEVRYAPVDRFPFVVAYFVDESKKLTVIFAVWHTARKPEKLKKRL